MKKLLKNNYYWFLDYFYVAYRQLISIVSRRGAASYRNPNGTPVIIIPGIYENWRFMQPLARVLFNSGYDVHTLQGLGFNRGSIEEMASVVSLYVTQNQLSDVLIVAHSKGGLIGKYALSQANTIKGLVTINTPFSGSKYAYVLPFRQLRMFIPNSKILTQLAGFTGINSKISSIYGMFDPHIPGGSELHGAHNIQIRSAYGHFRILSNRDVQVAVLNELLRLQ